jgi:hypothetical protein
MLRGGNAFDSAVASMYCNSGQRCEHIKISGHNTYVEVIYIFLVYNKLHVEQ